MLRTGPAPRLGALLGHEPVRLAGRSPVPARPAPAGQRRLHLGAAAPERLTLLLPSPPSGRGDGGEGFPSPNDPCETPTMMRRVLVFTGVVILAAGAGAGGLFLAVQQGWLGQPRQPQRH